MVTPKIVFCGCSFHLLYSIQEKENQPLLNGKCVFLALQMKIVQNFNSKQISFYLEIHINLFFFWLENTDLFTKELASKSFMVNNSRSFKGS